MATFTETHTGSATISTTEWDLPSNTAFTLGTDVVTTDGVFVLDLDVSALATNDRFRVRAYEKVTSGGSQLLRREWDIVGVQARDDWYTEPMLFMHGWAFTITKISGTDRSIAWSIRSVT